MNLIGYWITDLRDDQFCAPQEVVGYLPRDVRERVADYLELPGHSNRFVQCGFSWCRFFCGVEVLGCSEPDDGQWCWPEGLAHYVRNHGIILPDEFIAHVLEQPADSIATRRCGKGSKHLLEGQSEPFYLRQVDVYRFFEDRERFWIAWCAAHRSPTFLERLRLARSDAAKHVPDLKERAIAKEIARVGLSEEVCTFAGCRQKALRRTVMCARHTPGLLSGVGDGCYEITPDVMARLTA